MSIYKKNRGSIESIHQLGIGGPNLKNNSGVIEAKNAADSALAVVRMADPLGDTDGVAKGWVNSNFATEMDSLTYGRLKYNTNAQYQIEPISVGVKDFVYVNNGRVDISTPKVNNLSDNLLTATGTDSGAAPSPGSPTTYYSYLSNASASYAPSSLRLSATSPTSRYLAGSGNGANWLSVGAVELTSGPGSIIPTKYSVCGYGMDYNFDYLTVSAVRSSGGSGWYNLFTIANVILLDTTELQIFAQHSSLNSLAGYMSCRLYDSTAAATLSSYRDYSTISSNSKGQQMCAYTSASIQLRSFSYDFSYPGSGTTTYYAGVNETFVHVYRFTRG